MPPAHRGGSGRAAAGRAFLAPPGQHHLLGAEDKLGWLNHRAGHRYPPEAQGAAEAFLDTHLQPMAKT
ncbi:MAG: hypothetical protein KA257_14125 [Opitutaceae bacterium]|nr:hypothetical protein [Opitutaceae bacterium]